MPTEILQEYVALNVWITKSTWQRNCLFYIWNIQWLPIHRCCNPAYSDQKQILPWFYTSKKSETASTFSAAFATSQASRVISSDPSWQRLFVTSWNIIAQEKPALETEDGLQQIGDELVVFLKKKSFRQSAI